MRRGNAKVRVAPSGVRAQVMPYGLWKFDLTNTAMPLYLRKGSAFPVRIVNLLAAVPPLGGIASE